MSVEDDKLFPFLVSLWHVITQAQNDGLTSREVMLGLISTVYRTGLELGMTIPDIDKEIRHVRLSYGKPPHKH